MTSQTLVSNSPTRASASQTAVCSPEATALSSSESRVLKAMKSQYQVDQQVKFLNLQAETESLLQQLRALKQQRETSEVILSTQDSDRANS